ncbi:hypothetical protein QEN19_001152 [Hanseniaspora menglaensis]
MFKYNSVDEQDFKKVHTTHLLNKYKNVSLNDDMFPEVMAQLYKAKFYKSCKKNKLILPEQIRGDNLGKVRKISKWDTKNKRADISPDFLQQNGGTFSCNKCIKYMIPGQTSTIRVQGVNIIIQKCNHCGYELKKIAEMPVIKQEKESKSEGNLKNENIINKKQKNKNKNKLIIQKKMKQNQTAKQSSSSSSLNLMDFLK